MMLSIKSSSLEVSDAIRQYIEEKAVTIEKLVDGDSGASLEVEIGKTTIHHNKGPFMRAEFMLAFTGEVFRAEEEREDLYEAIDTAKDDLRRQVSEYKHRSRDEHRAPRLDKE
jgi:ribosomal subunit interface protein